MQCRKTLRQKLKAFVDSTKILRRSKDNMNKKFLSLVLALVMVLGTLTPVFAEEAAPKDKIEKAAKTAPSAKVQWLVDEKIVSGRKLFKDGDEKTDLSLDKNLQRDEITRLLVLGKGLENLANLVQGTMRPYVDVDNSNWANGVITVGSYHLKNTQGVPMLAGYPGNKFLPTRNVSYAELAKMLVCLVDNSITPKMVEKFQWPSDWMVRAANLGILAGVEVKDSKAFVTRQAAFEMLYNALYLYDTAHHVDYGTKYGVVSGYANGELRLNQGDKAFTVKYSGNTVYVNNSGYATYMPLGERYEGLVIGSLVRVIADKDGNATHIVELGNPVKGAIPGRWFGVADKTAQGYADFKDGSVKSNDKLTVYDGTWMDSKELAKFRALKPEMQANKAYDETHGKPATTINLTSNTRYFVADPMNNYLTEVDKATARKIVDKANYTHKTDANPNVYVGYDVLAAGKAGRETTEARVVVFNVVEDSFQDWATVRVTNPSNRNYNFFAENTKGEVTEYSLAKYTGAMPGYERPNGTNNTNTAGYRGQFEKLNVLALDLNKDTKEVFRTKTLIEYATAPSFKVLKLKVDHGQYILMDLEGSNGVMNDVRVDLGKTDIFLEGQWTPEKLEGQYIQLSGNNFGENETKDTGYSINHVVTGAISILDHAKNFGKFREGFAQIADRVYVDIKENVRKIDGKYFIEKDDLVFRAEMDSAQEMSIPGSFKTYTVDDKSADIINDALAAYNPLKPVRFIAEVVVKNGPVPEAMLIIKGIATPNTFEFGNKVPVNNIKDLSADDLTAIANELKRVNNNRTFTVTKKDANHVIISEANKKDTIVENEKVARQKATLTVRLYSDSKTLLTTKTVLEGDKITDAPTTIGGKNVTGWSVYSNPKTVIADLSTKEITENLDLVAVVQN